MLQFAEFQTREEHDFVRCDHRTSDLIVRAELRLALFRHTPQINNTTIDAPVPDTSKTGWPSLL
ncbi:hypothetical protein PG993_011820 [Apiospora rasikravindrae]|uniref:Uncharacterized protein n=1 Tax=Apiospora rasikravindrae TaxID=990691 RepID=A0ABR1S0R7_9PEZI